MSCDRDHTQEMGFLASQHSIAESDTMGTVLLSTRKTPEETGDSDMFMESSHAKWIMNKNRAPVCD